MDIVEKATAWYTQIKNIEGALNQTEDKFDMVELGYCLRVLREVNERDFNTIENSIFEMLQENKARLENLVHHL